MTGKTIECDVLVVGGAFSGAAAALLVKRRHPKARVIIVERTVEFDRKVGESTAEVSGCFLTRLLGLTQYLGNEHLPKYGLRMWFARDGQQGFEDCAELGARYQTRLPANQIDRAKLDEHLLVMAREAGCDVLRPARVTAIEPGDSRSGSRVTVRTGESDAVYQARWLVDASGRAAMLARKRGTLEILDEHPTNALWARFRGVADWDSVALRKRFPEYAASCRTGRSWATNHLMGYGWWCWIIPLKGGDTSIGLVYDSRLYSPPEGDSIPEKIRRHVMTHPVGREMLAGIEPVGDDARSYAQLAYVSREVADDGWIAIGDAAGFIDPLYSPGLDFCSYTAFCAADIIGKSLDGECQREATQEYNREYARTYRAWFETLYKDKYYYLGDAQLMSAALLLDVATYFIGPLRYVYTDTEREFRNLPFQGVSGMIFAKLMHFYNQRLSAMAKKRIARGTYGLSNAGWRELYDGFSPDFSVRKLLFKGLRKLLAAEITTLLARPRTSQSPGAGQLENQPVLSAPHSTR